MTPIGMIAAEPYDGVWSGITGGISLAAALVILATLIVVFMGLMNADNPIAMAVGANVWMYVGIGAVVMAIFAGIGFALGRRG